MIKLKNPNGEHLNLDGYNNFNDIHIAKKIFNKRNYCKTIKQAKAYGVNIAIITALKCGYNTLIFKNNKEIKLPPAIYKALEVIKQCLPEEFKL